MCVSQLHAYFFIQKKQGRRNFYPVEYVFVTISLCPIAYLAFVSLVEVLIVIVYFCLSLSSTNPLSEVSHHEQSYKSPPFPSLEKTSLSFASRLTIYYTISLSNTSEQSKILQINQVLLLWHIFIFPTKIIILYFLCCKLSFLLLSQFYNNVFLQLIYFSALSSSLDIFQ